MCIHGKKVENLFTMRTPKTCILENSVPQMRFSCKHTCMFSQNQERKKDLIQPMKNWISSWFGNSSCNFGNEATLMTWTFTRAQSTKAAICSQGCETRISQREVKTMEAILFLKFRQKTIQQTAQKNTYTSFQYPSSPTKKYCTFSVWPWFHYTTRQLYFSACFKITELLSIKILTLYCITLRLSLKLGLNIRFVAIVKYYFIYSLLINRFYDGPEQFLKYS